MPALRRRASSLPELLVALVLTAIAGLLGAGLLATTERRVRAAAADDRTAQLTRDVSHVLGSEISAAAWPGLVVMGDTALELDAHVGSSVACVVGPGSVVLPAATTTRDEPYTAWRQPAEAGDLLWALDTAGTWGVGVVAAVVERADGAGCPADGAFRTAADSAARRPVYRLTLGSPLPAGVLRGAPLRITRRVRWVLYRAADRQWWLGYRRCSAGCAAAQPVTGPFAAPGDSGLAFRVGSGAVVTVTFRPPAAGATLPQLARRRWSVRGAPAP
ncbi:MAG: hypothetical protein U9Q74_13945 [Gemmatimonadota bacterium]|nr:hypothetical protein [Gemmatimonadota bacterium]